MEKNKKQFIRTVPGKALLFLMINILMIAVLACTCVAAACIQEDFYGISEKEFYENKSEDYLDYKVIENSEYLIGVDHYAVEDMSIMITDKDGKYIASTRDFEHPPASQANTKTRCSIHMMLTLFMARTEHSSICTPLFWNLMTLWSMLR